MSKPSYMPQEIYELLNKAIEGLDTAANAIDEALYEMQSDDVREEDYTFDVDGELVEFEEVYSNLEDYKDDIETMSYRLWCLIGADKD